MKLFYYILSLLSLSPQSRHRLVTNNIGYFHYTFNKKFSNVFPVIKEELRQECWAGRSPARLAACVANCATYFRVQTWWLACDLLRCDLFTGPARCISWQPCGNSRSRDRTTAQSIRIYERSKLERAALGIVDAENSPRRSSFRAAHSLTTYPFCRDHQAVCPGGDAPCHTVMKLKVPVDMLRLVRVPDKEKNAVVQDGRALGDIPRSFVAGGERSRFYPK